MEPSASARRLANGTLGMLAVYAPIETWASLPALWSPFYLVDFVAIVVLAWGALRVRRANDARGVAILAAGYGWSGANAWRATFGRVAELSAGGSLEFGAAELWFVALGTVLSLAGLAWSTALVMRRRDVAASTAPL